MARFVSSIFPSMRRTSLSKLMSLARECFLRSASFSSSSTIGFSKSRGGIFMGGLLEGDRIAFAEQRREFFESLARKADSASGRFCFFVRLGVQGAMADVDLNPMRCFAVGFVGKRDAGTAVPRQFIRDLARELGLRLRGFASGRLFG